jgi:hypothetical protein
MSDRKLTGAEELRRIVRVMGDVRESFNDRFSAEQLLVIYRAHQACGWDYYPDQWTEGQVQAALRGVLPKWDDGERPIEGVG